jgi:hypothetical protein
MNILILILNRVYHFLTIVNNQSPLLGTVGIVMLLIYSTLNNILLLIYSFKPNPFVSENYIDFIEMVLIFILLFFYCKKNKEKIINHSKFSNLKNSLFVIILYLFTIVSFVFLAKINREKIFNVQEKKDIQGAKKKSLEGRVRQWFGE